MSCAFKKLLDLIEDQSAEVPAYTLLEPFVKFKKNPKQEWKYTDCVCGCFLYLNKKTFNDITMKLKD